MEKYKIRKFDGFTLAQCPTCGYKIWVGERPEKLIRIEHIKSPTLNECSRHKLIFRDATFDEYGCPYLPSLYPKLNVPIETKIRAIIENAKMLAEADALLKIADFTKNPFSFFDKTKTEVR